MTQSIFEQQDLLDKLFCQLKRDYQEGRTPDYESLVTIAPTMTKNEYEQMIERFTAYMRGKEIDALNEHEAKIRAQIPFLPENLNTGVLGIELELLKHLNSFIISRDLRVAESVDRAMNDLRVKNAALEQELMRMRQEIHDKDEAISSLSATLASVKDEHLTQQQLIESMSLTVDTLDLLQCVNSGESRLSVESLPVNLKLREDMNDLLSRAQSLSPAERAALSGMIFKAGAIVKTAKALGFSVCDLKRDNGETTESNPLAADQKLVGDAKALGGKTSALSSLIGGSASPAGFGTSSKEVLSESTRALGAVPPLPEEFRHLEQLGADDSYSDEFDSDDDDSGVSFAQVAAALAAASAAKHGSAPKNDVPNSLKVKSDERLDIFTRIGRGTADNMSELISAMQGSEGNVIARRLEERQARRDASMVSGEGVTEAQNYKAAELASMVQERTSTHAERIAAQSCLNALASGEEESQGACEVQNGPAALAEKIMARVNSEANRIDDGERVFNQIAVLVDKLLMSKKLQDLKPQDIENLVHEALQTHTLAKQSGDVLRRLAIKMLLSGRKAMNLSDMRATDDDIINSFAAEEHRAFARMCLQWGRSLASFSPESNKKDNDSDGVRPTPRSAISALISGVSSDSKLTSGVTGSATNVAVTTADTTAATATAGAAVAGEASAASAVSAAGTGAAAASAAVGAGSADASASASAVGEQGAVSDAATTAAAVAGATVSVSEAPKNLADHEPVSSDLANVGSVLRSEIEDIKNRFDAAFDSVHAKPASVINAAEPKALPREEGTLVRTMAADRSNENVAAFAEASAKIEKLAPLLHDAGKEIVTARAELDNAITNAKVNEELERLKDEYTPASKSLNTSSVFSFGKDEGEKEDKNTATDEITSVAKDVVKVADALEEASGQKRDRKESLFGGNSQGVTVYGPDSRKLDAADSLEESDADSSLVDEGEDLSDFVTGNVSDINPIKVGDQIDLDYGADEKDQQIKHHMDPYDQGRISNPESKQAMHTSLSQNTNVVVDNGKYNEPRVTNPTDVGSTVFNFASRGHVNPNAALSERAPVQKAADQLKDVLSAALSAAPKDKLDKDGITTTDTTAIIKSSEPPKAVDPTGRIMTSEELRQQQLQDAQRAKGEGPSTLITKTDPAAAAAATAAAVEPNASATDKAASAVVDSSNAKDEEVKASKAQDEQGTTTKEEDSQAVATASVDAATADTPTEAGATIDSKEEDSKSEESSNKSALITESTFKDSSVIKTEEANVAFISDKELNALYTASQSSAVNEPFGEDTKGTESQDKDAAAKVEHNAQASASEAVDTTATASSSSSDTAASASKDDASTTDKDAEKLEQFVNDQEDFSGIKVIDLAESISEHSHEVSDVSKVELAMLEAEFEKAEIETAEAEAKSKDEEAAKATSDSDANAQVAKSEVKAEVSSEADTTAKADDASVMDADAATANDASAANGTDATADAVEATTAANEAGEATTKSDADAAAVASSSTTDSDKQSGEDKSKAAKEEVEVGAGAAVLGNPAMGSSNSSIFGSQPSFGQVANPFAVLMDPSKVYCPKGVIDEEDQRSLEVVTDLLEKRINSHVDIVKNTLAQAGGLASFNFADFESYYSSCIDSLEKDGYVNKRLKGILIDKMKYDLKHDGVSKFSFASSPSIVEPKKADEAKSKEPDSKSSEVNKEQEPSTSELQSSESETHDSATVSEPSTQVKSEDLEQFVSNDAEVEESETFESNEPKHKEPGFVILDKDDSDDDASKKIRDGFSSLMTRILSGRKDHDEQESSDRSKSAGFFILKDDDSDKSNSSDSDKQ